MSKTYNEILESISDEELKDAYFEIKEWKDTGDLKDGVIRKIYHIFLNINKFDSLNFPIHIIKEFVLMEIARRKYELIKD